MKYEDGRDRWREFVAVEVQLGSECGGLEDKELVMLW